MLGILLTQSTIQGEREYENMRITEYKCKMMSGWTSKDWWKILNRDSIGIELKHARMMSELTQEELAKKVGVEQPDVSAWESGKRTPSIRKLRKIANAMCHVVRVKVTPFREVIREEIKDCYSGSVSVSYESGSLESMTVTLPTP